MTTCWQYEQNLGSAWNHNKKNSLLGVKNLSEAINSDKKKFQKEN